MIFAEKSTTNMHSPINFEPVVANISQVVIVLDRDLQIVWANAKAVDAAGGRDPGGQKCYKIYQDRESPCPGCHTLKTFDTGEMIPNQSTVTYEDGSCRYFDGFTVVVGRDDQGDVSLVAEVAGEVPKL